MANISFLLKCLFLNINFTKKTIYFFSWNPSFLILMTLLLFTQGCGRKRSNLFNFESQKQKPHNRLKLPAPKITSLDENSKENITTIRWLTPTQESTDKQELTHYVIYDINRNGLICRTPRDLIKANQLYFHDHSIPAPAGYLVRGIFKINGKNIEGSSSNIILKKKVPPT